MHFFNRRTLSLLLLFSVVFTATQAIGTELNIYYSNDMHGKVEPCG